MKKIILLIALFLVSIFAFKGRGSVLNKPLVLNSDVTVESVNKLWNDIRYLHGVLPSNQAITVYLNSNGGDAQSITILLERIKQLQKSGRKFIGLIYGYCYSACGSLFAIMDKRYMTASGVYMQHAAYYPGGIASPTQLLLLRYMDVRRLAHDAKFLKMDVDRLMERFQYSSYVATAATLFSNGLIDGIVTQPNIAEI